MRLQVPGHEELRVLASAEDERLRIYNRLASGVASVCQAKLPLWRTVLVQQACRLQTGWQVQIDCTPQRLRPRPLLETKQGFPE